MVLAISKNGPKFYLNLVAMILIMFVFRIITPPEGLTSEGLAVVGVFFGVLYGWLFIDMIWPSFMGLVVLGMTLPQPMDTVLGGAFGNNTFLLLLFFCMVASIINSAGIAEYVARRIISVPIVAGRPYVLIFMLCIAMCALATMLTMTAAVLVGFPLIKEVCRQYGYKPGDVFPMILLLAMLYVADIAYMMLPFKSLPAIVFGVYEQLSGGQEINLTAYVGVTCFLLLLSIFFVLFMVKYVFKVDLTPILTSRERMHFNEELSTYQKTILWSFVGLIVLLLLPNITPKDWITTKFLKAMGNNGILLAYIGIYLKDPESFDSVTKALEAIPEVVECHFTTGKYDMFIKIYAKNNHHLLSIIHDKLQPLGLARTETLISFHEAIKRQMPIDIDFDDDED